MGSSSNNVLPECFARMFIRINIAVIAVCLTVCLVVCLAVCCRFFSMFDKKIRIDHSKSIVFIADGTSMTQIVWQDRVTEIVCLRIVG